MTTALSDAGLQFADLSIQPSAAAPQIYNLTASVTANALTVSLGACPILFQNPTLTNGTPVLSQLSSALSITVPSTSNLGRAVSAGVNRLVALVAYNGSSPVLCLVNIAGGTQLDETNLLSPTTISGASSSASVVYSASAVSANSPYKIVGFVDATFTDGTGWISPITQVRGAGGEALTAMGSLGYGQTWQNVTVSRALGTTYYNTTGRSILAAITLGSINGVGSTFIVNGVTTGVIQNNAAGTSTYSTTSLVIPPGASYSVNAGATLNVWAELR